MTLTPSEVASISASLSFWERVEYVAEFLVFLGCAGEIVPGKLTCLRRHIREVIEKWSSYLLLAALILSLIALLKTNTFSGSIVDSLGNEAKTAFQKSNDARDMANEAENTAGEATNLAGEAKVAATDAKAKASSALTLARDTRTEADSFTADIASAKKEAADTHEGLRQFLLFRSPRAKLVGTSPGLGFVDKNGLEFAKAMTPFAEQKIEVRHNLAQISDPSEQEEIKRLLNSIEVVLGFNAHWKLSLREDANGPREGVAVGVAANATNETKKAAEALATELGSRLVTDEFGRTPIVFVVKRLYKPPDRDTVVLYVGKHP